MLWREQSATETDVYLATKQNGKHKRKKKRCIYISSTLNTHRRTRTHTGKFISSYAYKYYQCDTAHSLSGNGGKWEHILTNYSLQISAKCFLFVRNNKLCNLQIYAHRGKLKWKYARIRNLPVGIHFALQLAEVLVKWNSEILLALCGESSATRRTLDQNLLYEYWFFASCLSR